MIDLNSQFFAILTKVGEAKQANADALGIPWNISQMGVGDAHGTDPIPDRLQTRLINERRRAPLNQLMVDPLNASVLIAEQIIPADVGGWWVREIGLYDADGDLVAVANCAPSFKPLLSQGSGRTQIVRMNFIISSITNVVLKIDPAIVLATREYVDRSIESVLPSTRKAGSYRQVTINKYGVVVSSSNPKTLLEYEIRAATTAEVVEGVDDSKPVTSIGVAAAISGKANKATTLSGYGVPVATSAEVVEGKDNGKPVTSLGVAAAIAHLVDSSPESLDTLKELADALGGDPHFSTTVLNLIAKKADKATTLHEYGVLVATSAEAVEGKDDVKPVTSLGVSDAIKSADPWGLQPLGVPFAVFDNLAGNLTPPTNKHYRYVTLTANDSYNTGVLINEIVSGSSPLVAATAVVNLPGSPMHGKTISLINTEQRVLRAAPTAGQLLQDALQNITGSTGNNIGAFDQDQSGAFTNAVSTSLRSSPSVSGPFAGTLSFDASRVARTANETRVKSIGVTYFLRVK